MILLEKIAKSIPAPVVDLCRELRQHGYQAWLVGGAIRDLVMERGSADFDIATSARPAEVRRVFGHSRSVPTGEKHGTITVLLPNIAGFERGVEVTTFRGEGAYTDGRRPDSVEFVSDLTQDLERRDFTINSLAFDPLDGVLVDPFNGQQDIADKLIRAVGEPLARLREDGLRVMRAVRFAAQLGFTLDPPTQAALPQTLDVLARVSHERIRDELLKLLAAPRPSVGLRIMQATGVLAEVLPEAVGLIGLKQNRFHAYDAWEHTLATVDETSGTALIRLAALLHDLGKFETASPHEDVAGDFTFYQHECVGARIADAVCRRLKLSNKERERVVALVRHHMFWYTPDWSDARLRRFMARVGVELLPELYALHAGDMVAHGMGQDPSEEITELKRRVAGELESRRALKVSDLAIGGKEVMEALACAPGPNVGEILHQLWERVLDEPALNERDRLLALIPEIAREVKG